MTDKSDVYSVGVIAKPSGMTNFAFQASNLTIESDEYEVKDENGNTIATKNINHRCKITLDATIPAAAGVPVPGEEITIPDLTIPTVSADGTVSGDFAVVPDSTTTYKFKITGTPAINQSNQDFIKASFEATRWLVNGIPGSSSSSL